MQLSEIKELQAQANSDIEQGIESLKSAMGDGVSIMSLMMNPDKAVEQFGGGVMQVFDGVEKMRSVMNELVDRLDEE